MMETYGKNTFPARGHRERVSLEKGAGKLLLEGGGRSGTPCCTNERTIRVAKEYDPRMHSAEHILNQTMVRMFDRGRSFSAHIEKKKSKVDYHFDRDLTGEERAEIERRVNEVIAADLDVREEFLSRGEATALFNLSRLPDEAGERIRIIRIGDYDSCPCSGLHVHRSGEIGEFRIISTGFDEGVLRIRFRLHEGG